jgi:hypothetical protein
MRHRLVGRFFVRTLLRQLVQELLKSGPEFPVLAEGQRLHPAQLIELPLPRHDISTEVFGRAYLEVRVGYFTH